MACILIKYLGVAQFGSVLEWGSRGRRFKSSHPDQNKNRWVHPIGFCFAVQGLYSGIAEGHRGSRGFRRPHKQPLKVVLQEKTGARVPRAERSGHAPWAATEVQVLSPRPKQKPMGLSHRFSLYCDRIVSLASQKPIRFRGVHRPQQPLWVVLQVKTGAWVLRAAPQREVVELFFATLTHTSAKTLFFLPPSAIIILKLFLSINLFT